MIRSMLYAATGLIVGLLIGIGVTSSHMITHIERMDHLINEYGLNTFLYGCVEGRRSEMSCLDVTRQNEANIILPEYVK